jgi:hypothetical protein
MSKPRQYQGRTPQHGNFSDGWLVYALVTRFL